MADAAPVPIPGFEDPAAPGGLFATYSGGGAAGQMFAPAYIKGYAPSEEAWGKWAAARRPSQEIVDELRMPNLYQNPDTNPTMGGGDVYGNGIKQNLTFGDQRGQVDPNALRVASQGGVYDVAARRSAIAERLALNELRMNPPKPALPSALGEGIAGTQMSPDEYRRKIIGDHSGYWGEG